MTDPTPTPPLDLPALKEIAQAEPSHRWGQWTVENDDWEGFIIFADDGLPGQTIVAKGISQGIDEGESTANFIAALDPPTVLALIARAEAAEAKVAAVRAMAERFWPESLADAVPRTEADRTARVIATRLRAALGGVA